MGYKIIKKPGGITCTHIAIFLDNRLVEYSTEDRLFGDELKSEAEQIKTEHEEFIKKEVDDKKLKDVDELEISVGKQDKKDIIK